MVVAGIGGRGLAFVAGRAFVEDAASAFGDDHDVGRLQRDRAFGIFVNDPDPGGFPMAAGMNAQTHFRAVRHLRALNIRLRT